MVLTLRKDLSSLDMNDLRSEAVFELFFKYYLYFAPKVNIILAKQISKFDKDSQAKFFYLAEEENETIANRAKKKRTKEIVKRLEFFLGSLSDKQIALIDSNMYRYQKLNGIRLKRRLDIQSKLKDILKQSNSENRSSEVSSLFSSFINLEKAKSDFKEVIELMNTLYKTITPKQLAALKARQVEALEWIDAFIEYYKK